MVRSFTEGSGRRCCGSGLALGKDSRVVVKETPVQLLWEQELDNCFLWLGTWQRLVTELSIRRGSQGVSASASCQQEGMVLTRGQA